MSSSFWMDSHRSAGSSSSGSKLTGRNSSSPATRRAARSAQQQLLEVKSKFDAEFRRFSISRASPPSMTDFRALVCDLHSLDKIPFTMCYTDAQGELLPITNDDNFRVALTSSCRGGVLKMLIQRKGESWEEKYGYGTSSIDRRRAKGLSLFSGLPAVAGGDKKRNYNISMPQDFRLVSAVIDVDVVPETHRRVKLCKYDGGNNKPLGFYIRDGTSVRVTASGVLKVPGIFISRLVPGGLAEMTGLLAVNDEVLEVNSIEVTGKTLDQVTDMMVANASNLIITVKPANQRATLHTSTMQHRASAHSFDRTSSLADELHSDDDDDDDQIHDVSQKNLSTSAAWSSPPPSQIVVNDRM